MMPPRHRPGPPRRLIGGLIGGVCLAVSLLPAALPGAAEPLGRISVPIRSLQLELDTRPDLDGLQTRLTAVKDVPTAVHTRVGLPGLTAVAGLPEGALVKADLRGPAFGEAAVPLEALPDQPLEIQGLRVPGDYLLSDVRLEGPDGRRILARDPAAEPVLISVIDKLLVTQVTSRALSAEEIKEKGIVIDEENFTALNFTVGLTLGSEQVEIDMPVVIPATRQAMQKVERVETISLPAVQRAFDRINIPNFSLTGFQLRPPPELEEEKGLELPPINGVIVIPGNIGFLNQFFSVVLQATNVAPDGSDLVLHQARAHIRLPPGGDDMQGTGDDPLRVAETRDRGVQEALPLLDAGGEDAIAPQATHQAEFLVEGVREGTHRLRFDIAGDLFVPSLGERVPLTGEAAGLVQVKNPTFGLSMAHPDVVREGEDYSVFVTVTNTSRSPANFFRLGLDTRSLSGARLGEGEEDVRTLDSLLPGDARSFEFRLVAETTGEVTGTVFLADAGINGSFVLTTGVGDTGIPLSPDTLVLPKTVDHLPRDPAMLFQAVRLLGQAYSVATAPAGSLPPAIPRVSKGFVFDRAVKLAQAGLHVRFGEPGPAAARDVLMDYLGAPGVLAGEDDDLQARDWAAFDALRRAADAGHDFVAVLGELLGGALPGEGAATLQRDWAEAFASRGAHLSAAVAARGPPPRVRVTDGEERVLGTLDPDGKPAREIPYAALVPLQAGADESASLVMAVRPGEACRLELGAPEATEITLSLVLPEGAGMVQLRYPGTRLDSGGSARLDWRRDGGPPLLIVDRDGDGAPDAEVEAVETLAVVDRPPRLLGAQQWAKGSRPFRAPSFEHGDPLGRLVGLLYDEEVDPETAADPLSYGVAGNRVTEVALQPDRRLVFLVLDRPVGPFVSRELQVEGVRDRAGRALEDAAVPIRGDPERGLAGRFRGQVVSADGRPVPFATVKYIQPLEFPALLTGGCAGSSDVRDFEVSEYQADARGRFSIDYVLAAEPPPDCPSNPDVWLNENNPGGTANFKLEALDPETGEVGKASARIHFDGQAMGFKVIIRGYGAIAGTLYDEQGEVVTGGDPGTADSIAVHARNISTGESYRSWVDAEGRYAFPRRLERDDGPVREAPRVAVGNLILRAVRPDGHTAVTTANLPAAGSRTTQDLLLVAPNRFGKVRGRVLEAGGERGAAHLPVQLAGRVLGRLDLYERGYTTGVVADAVTDAEGFFEMDRVPAGPIELRALRRSTYEQADARARLEPESTAEVTLVLPGTGGTVRGVVRDGLGRLVAGAQVAGGPSLTETDDQGRFEIRNLPLGEYRVQARGPDSPALGEVRAQTLGPDDVQEVVITLEPLGSLAGTVYRADRETSAAGQKVQLWAEPDRGVLAETFTTPEGAFRFEDYPVGDYSVRAVEADHGDGGMTYTRIRYAGDRRDVDIVYRGLGSVEGRVVQAGAGPQAADVLLRRKVWRVLTEADREGGNVFVQAMRKVQETVDEASAERIEGAMIEAGLTRPSGEFFMLVDETTRRSSKSLDAEGVLEGRFRFDRVLAGPFEVAAFGPFLAPAEVRGQVPGSRDPAGRAVDLGDIELTPATARLHGRVYLPDGETPAGEGVEVTVRSLDSSGSVLSPAEGGGTQPVLPEYSVRTGPGGRYAFPLVLRGRFVLRADTGVPEAAAATVEALRLAGEDAPNARLYARASGSVPAGEDLGVDLRLEAVGAVQVEVVGAGGRAVPRAEVSLTTASDLDADEEAGLRGLRADAQGRITLFPVIAGRFAVSARDPVRAARGQANGDMPAEGGVQVPVTVTLGAVTDASGEVVQVAGFGTVAGQVRKADGTPLDNPAQVRVRSAGLEVLATTDSQGRYRAEDVPAGRVRVEAFEPYTARRGSAAGHLAGQDSTLELAVSLAGLGTVSGTVWSSDGEHTRPALDVLLHPSGRFSDRLITRSDTRGAFTLPGVPEGPYRVEVRDHETGLRGDAGGRMPADGAEVTTDVRLEAAGAIAGIVYGAGVHLDARGRPVDAGGRLLREPSVVAAARVDIRGTRAGQSVQADARGRFRTAPVLPLGEYRVTVRPPEGADGARTRGVLAHEGQVLDVPVALAGRGRVAGVVMDSLGEGPVPLARVTLVSTSPFSTGAVRRMTGPDGRFAFEDVPVGDWSLDVLTTLGEPRLGGAIGGRLGRHGEEVVLDGDRALRLEPSGRILGRALLPDGRTPADGTVVELEGERLRLARVADEGGRFLFEAVPLGEYRLGLREQRRNAVGRAEVALSENGQVQDLGDRVLDGEPPRVLSSRPEPGGAGVATGEALTVSLSERLDAASVNDRTVQLLVAGRPLAAEVALEEGRRIRVVPARPIPDLTPVVLRVKAHRLGFGGRLLAPGVQDLAGRGLEEDFELAFTTADTRPPELVSTSPRDGATGVDPRSVVRVELSEPVRPASVKSFRLSREGRPIPGALNTETIEGGKVLVFTPREPFQANARYRGVLEGPLEDLAGNAMEQARIVTEFSTFDTLPPEIAAVRLAEGVSAVQGKTVPLQVVVKGADVVRVECFREADLVASDGQAPYVCPVRLDAAPGGEVRLGAVAVDAAGNRSPRARLTLRPEPNRPPEVRIAGPAELSVSAGQTLSLRVAGRDDVGLRQLGFTADGGRTASDTRPLDGPETAEARFTLDVPYDLPVGARVAVEALAEDALGLVSRSAPLTLAVTGRMPPRVRLSGVENNAAVDPGAKLVLEVRARHGSGIRELSLSAQGAFSFSKTLVRSPPRPEAEGRFVVRVPESVPPTETLTLTARAADTAGSGGTTSLTLRINDRRPPEVELYTYRDRRDVEPGTALSMRIRARDETGVERVALAVDRAGEQVRDLERASEADQHFEVRFPEDIPLGAELAVVASAEDRMGNRGEARLSLTAKDLRGPRVSILSPARDAVLEAGQRVVVEAEAEDPFAVSALEFSAWGVAEAGAERLLDPPVEKAAARFSVQVPDTANAGGTVGLKVVARDRAGNAGEAGLHLKVRDRVRPRVLSMTPEDGAEGVLPTARLRFRFSEGIKRSSFTTDSLAVEGPDGSPVPGRAWIGYNSDDGGFDPEQPLERGAAYEVRAGEGVTDWWDNPLEPFGARFTTDGTGPRLLSLEPARDATGVSARPALRAAFDEPLDPDSLGETGVRLVDEAGEVVPGRVELLDGNRSLRLSPDRSLGFGRSYRLVIAGTLTDRAGNPVTDEEGRTFGELASTFTTGALRLVSPDGPVREHEVVLLEARSEGGLSFPAVRFEVGGRVLRPVPGPPYRTRVRVPARSAGDSLAVITVALDEEGRELARTLSTLPVSAALRPAEPFLGVPRGGRALLGLRLSAPLAEDLAVRLAASDPGVLSLPEASLRLPAGETRIDVPVDGVAEGRARIRIDSDRGGGTVIAAVSAAVAGRTLSLATQPAGLSLAPGCRSGSLTLPGPGTHGVHLPILAEPASADLRMELTSDDPAVLQVPPTAQIGAGSRVLGLQLRAVAAGRARLELRHGGRLTCVSVAVAPDARPPGVAGTPVSLAVRPLTLLGEVGLPAGPRRTLSLHLPGGPVAGPVRLRSHRPDVVAVPGEVRPEPAGPRVELELDAVAPGEALVELDSGDHRWALVVRVGGPGQATAGQPAAVAVRPAAFTAELHLPRQGERTLSLPLLAEAAGVDTRVALASSDPSVVQVPAQALIPAGSRLATLALGAGREGRSELRIEVPGQVLRLPVRVGGAPVGPRTGTASWGLSVRPTGTAGRVHMGDRRRLTLDLPLFPGPADRDRTVTLTSRRPEVADTAEGTVTVPAGRTSAEVTFVARRVAGTVVFDVDRAGEQDTLELLLGRVADGPVVAPAVGVEIK